MSFQYVIQNAQKIVWLFFSGKLEALTIGVVGDIYNYYKRDMEITRDQFNTDVTKWKHKWSGKCDNEKPQTLVEALDHANPQLYPEIYVALVILLSYPVSPCAAERSQFKNVDIDNVVSEF